MSASVPAVPQESIRESLRRAAEQARRDAPPDRPLSLAESWRRAGDAARARQVGPWPWEKLRYSLAKAAGRPLPEPPFR